MALADRVYGTHIDMEELQIKQHRLENLVNDPVTTSAGLLWYNSTDDVAKVWDGSNARELYADDDDFYNNAVLITSGQDTDEILVADASDSYNYKRITRANFLSGTAAITNAYYRIIAETGVANLDASGEDSIPISGDGSIIQSVGAGTGDALSMEFIDQLANRILAGPPSGGATTPAFRALVDADMPVSYNATDWNTAYTHSTIVTGNPHSVTAVQAGAEPALGNPGSDGYLLSSTAAGARSWVTPDQLGGQDLDVTITAPTILEHGYSVTWDNINSRYELTNVAASSGVGISGIPVADQVAVWGDPSSILGDANFTWDGSVLDVTGGMALSAATVNFTGLGSDDAEDHVIAIDDSTGLLSKRSVASLGSGSFSFGTTTQIPYMNGAGNDFLYSADFTYDGTDLIVDGNIYTGTNGDHIGLDTHNRISGIRTAGGRLDIDGGGSRGLSISSTFISVSKYMYPYGTTKTLDLGTNTQFWRDFYIDRIFLDTNSIYIDVSGTDMIFTDGSNTDVTLSSLAAAGSGTVSSVVAGNGMDFTTITTTGSVVMGTPTTPLSPSTTDAVTATSHTHSITGFAEISGTPSNNEIALWTNATDIEGDANLAWNGTVLAVVGGMSLSTATVNFTGLGSDDTEDHVIAIDDATGLLSKRSVASLGGGGSMVYPGAGIALSTGSAWDTSIVDNSADWNTAYGWGDHSGLYANLSHAHGNITNAGAIGSTTNLPIITTTAGVLIASSFGSGANTFCEGDDARLSDARTPSSHTLLSHTISGETTGHVLAADSATTFSIRELLGSEIDNDLGWTTNAGTVTSVTGGTGIDSTGGATPDISLDLSELSVTTMVAGDWIAFDDAGTSNKALISAIPLSIFDNDDGWTSNAGTVDTTGSPANTYLARFTDADTITGDTNITWSGTVLAVTGGMSLSTATVNFTGLGDDDTEDHVIAIDDSTGLLSKRSVASIGGLASTGTIAQYDIAW